MLNRPGFLILFLATLAPLYAQTDGPIKMTPELALTFPVTMSGHDVTVKYPILINRTTILKPGMVLRVLYVLSNHSQETTDLVVAHHGTMEQSYSRDMSSTSDKDQMSPEVAHEVEGYRRTIWGVTINFELALAQLPTDSLHLIYSPDGKDNHLLDDRFNFYDGLMVGFPDGKVTAIAVENGSKMDAAGIKAGDEILAVGGTSLQNNLSNFPAAYAAAKKEAKDNEAPSYIVTVRSPGRTEIRDVPVGMPPTLKGGLMDGFNEH